MHEFGPFRFDSGQRVLYRGEQPVPLEPKIADTLEALLERRGEVVGKAELIRRVWPDCSVDEAGLARNISILRKALGEEGEAYIETVPKRGYRFVAAERAAEPSPVKRRSRGWIVAAGLVLLAGFIYWQFYLPSAYVPSSGEAALVALIPPECLSPELERDAFCEGLASTLVAELSSFKGIQLVSPSTVARYRRVGIPTAIMTRVLGVQVVVEGTAQVMGDRVRIAMRMSDVRAGRLIWAEVYESGAGDRRQAQAEAGRVAAGHIAARLNASR